MTMGFSWFHLKTLQWVGCGLLGGGPLPLAHPPSIYATRSKLSQPYRQEQQSLVTNLNI